VSSYARRREMSSLARTGSHVNPLLVVPAFCTLCARPRGDGRFIGSFETASRMLDVTNNSSTLVRSLNRAMIAGGRQRIHPLEISMTRRGLNLACKPVNVARFT